MRNMFEKNKVKCGICNKGFTSTASKNKHIRAVHENERPFECSQCDKTFTRGEHVRNHMKSIHSKEKPFACTLCELSFKRPDGLKTHLKTHQKREKTVKCKVCEESFYTNATLVTHELVHTGERPYNCIFQNKGRSKKPHEGPWWCRKMEISMQPMPEKVYYKK
jgi:KRAB domain-containing zinc finger protein